jgi:hypothetical protein
MSWIAQVAATPLMPGSWTLGSAGALLTLAWNAVSEAQPSSLDRLGRSIGAAHECLNSLATPETGTSSLFAPEVL